MKAALVLAIAACGAPTTAVGTPPPPAPPVQARAVRPEPSEAPAPCTTATRGPATVVRDAGGDKLEIVPVDTWYTAGISWVGEELALVRRFSEIPYSARVQNAIDRWSPADRRMIGRVLLPGDVRAVTASPDGTRLALASENRLALVDAATGAEEAAFAVTGTAAQIVFTGAPKAPELLVALGGKAILFDRTGSQLDAFQLGGTTPTITRVYGRDPDHPTRHDNILRDHASWIVSLAASRDGKTFALGGSDSKVRLVTRGSPAQRVLEHKWSYVEHRHMGGNPDLNAPLAMRFTDDGKQLVVTYTHGEILTWDVARGAQVGALDGACTPAEAEVMANLYTPAGEPRRPASPEDVASCARGQSAVIAPDGSWVATNIGVTRVRALPGGAPLALLTEAQHIGMLGASRGGTLAMVDLYGRILVWSRAAKAAVQLAPASPNGTIDPRISASGRILAFESERASRIWDLATGEDLTAKVAAPARLLAVSGDARRALVATPTGHELRTGVTGPAKRIAAALPAGEASFSDGGDRILIASTGEHVVYDVARDAAVTIKPSGHVRQRVLSADGRRLATFAERTPIEVWDTGTGRALGAFEIGVRAAALSPNGRRLLSVTADKAQTTATLRDVTGGAPPTKVALRGWINNAAWSPDDTRIVFVMNDRFVMYDVADGNQHDVPFIGSPQRAAFSHDGALLLLESYYQVEVRRADDLTVVATVYPLRTGGYLIASAAGAVTGTPDARESIVVRATGALGTRVLPGTTAWDRFAQPDVHACAVAGAISAPRP